MTESTQEMATAPMPRKSPWRGRRFPNSRISANDRAGRAKMIQTCVSMVRSTLQQIDFGDVDRSAVAVDEQDDGETDTDLGGGYGDHEQGEDLPRRRPLK